MNYCLLRLVDADCNNNREYEMNQISDTQFEASWGRIKGTKIKKIYSMKVWNKIKEKKITDGYTDVTKTVAVVKKITKYSEISNKTVRKLVDELLKAANEHICNSYQVDKKDVTTYMVEKAQEHIDNMNDYANNKDLIMFNNEFQKLLLVIPQKIKCVSEIMAKDCEDMFRICVGQQTTLDVLKSVVDIEKIEPEEEKLGTILDMFGIEISPCTNEEISMLKKMLTSEAGTLLDSAFRVRQYKLETRYQKYVDEHKISARDEHLLWHGTRNENIWSIAKKGMLLNPKVITNGKRFGYGLYFAPNANKSIYYTSLEGANFFYGNKKKAYMFVMKVAYQKPLNVYNDCGFEYFSFREKDIKKHKCDALYCHESWSEDDEIVVYNEAQVCPNYLLVLKKDTKKTA